MGTIRVSSSNRGSALAVSYNLVSLDNDDDRGGYLPLRLFLNETGMLGTLYSTVPLRAHRPCLLLERPSAFLPDQVLASISPVEVVTKEQQRKEYTSTL